MRFDTVVFTQEELISAVELGFTYIALCDNEFLIPTKPDIHYTALGCVSAGISVTPESAALCGITFDGFRPEFGDMQYAFVPWKDESLLLGGVCNGSYASSYSSFAGSYASSYASSYTSFAAFFYGWEYEYESGSFASSYSSSYFGSYAGSYMSSYRDPYAHIINPFILVNGYGIDLI